MENKEDKTLMEIVQESIEQVDEVTNNLSDENPNTPFGIIDETDDVGSDENESN